MLRVSWLSGVRGRLICKLRGNLGGGRQNRRKSFAMMPVAVQLLEPRLVMTVTPPISLSTATTNATNARNALIAARNSFVTTVGTADQQYSADLTQHQTNYTNDVQTAENQFDTNVSGIESGLQTTLAGLDSGLETQLNADEASFEGAINGDVTAFNAAMAGPEATLTSDFANHATAFTSAIDGANTTLNTAINGTGGLRPGIDGFVQAQETLFQSNVTSENTTFTSYVNGPTGPVATYQSAEAADWAAYLTAIDSSPTGLEGIYNSNVAGDVTTRNTALTPYAYFNYDPSVLEGTPGYISLLYGANTTLQSNLSTAQTQYNNHVTTHEQNFQNAIYGPTGAMAAYNMLMVPVDNQLTVDEHNAEVTYDGAVQTAEGIYNTAVDGPTGFQHTFDVNVAGDKTTYDGLVSAAAGTRDGLIATAKNTYDGQVLNEEQAYWNWETVNNPYVQQMQARTQTLMNQLTTLVNNFNNNQIQPLQTALQNSINSANASYNSQANNSTTGFVTQLNNAISSDYQTALGVVQPEYTNYQGQVNALFSSYMMAMMNAMMNGLPMPPPPTTAEETLTQNYQLQVAAENITLTDQLGAAMVAYVTSERAADTGRDQAIVAAINSDDQTAINDADSLEGSEIADIHSWLDDMANIETAFEIADESHYVTMMDNIGDDLKTFVQAEDADEEAFEVIESNDYLAYEQQVDAEVEAFRNNEMGARITMLDSDADAERDYEKSLGLAEKTWLTGEASAERQYAILADAAEQQRENDEAGDYTQYLSDVAGDYQAWINTVTNGIAAQYAAYFGGAADATAVANAWKQYDQNVASDWDNLVVGEANDFQSYVQQEESALDTAEDDIAAHNETREDNIATDLLNEVNTLAPAIDTFEHSVDGLMAPWMTTAAGAEKTEGDGDAGSENTFELILAPQTQTLYDNEATDEDTELHTAESDDSAEFTNVVNAEDAAALLEDTQFDIELTTIRQKHTNLETLDLASWDTKELADLPADDALMAAYAADQQAQADLSAVNNFNNISAQPLPSFDSQLWQQASLMPMAMTFVTTDGDYLNWGGAIAGIGPVAPTSFLQEIQESVQPSNQSFLPLTGINPLMPMPGPPQDFVDWLRQNQPGLIRATPGDLNLSMTPEAAAANAAEVAAWNAARPKPPTLMQSVVPFYGSYLDLQYNIDQSNFLGATFDVVMLASDVFLVTAAGKGLGKAGISGAKKLLADEATALPKLSGLGAEATAQSAAATAGAVEAVTLRNGADEVLRGASISLEQAAEAAMRNGIDMRMIQLRFRAESGYYGSLATNLAGTELTRASNGRAIVTLTGNALASEADAVNTIAHELHHIRQVLAGRELEEEGARLAGDLAELFIH